jgi:hypothetical protein
MSKCPAKSQAGNQLPEVFGNMRCQECFDGRSFVIGRRDWPSRRIPKNQRGVRESSATDHTVVGISLGGSPALPRDSRRGWRRRIAGALEEKP